MKPTLRTTSLALALLAAAAPIAAQAGPSTVASDPVAEKLFRDGKALMKSGQIAEACQAYDASEKTEHNVSTAMNLADCRERREQLATAWALYLQVVAESRADTMLARLAEIARDRAAAIEPHLSYLVINVPEEHHVDGLEVWRDHVPLDHGAWNRAIPLDGGAHLIEARVPGHETWSTTLSLAVRDDRQSVEIPGFTELSSLVPLAPPGRDAPPPPSGVAALSPTAAPPPSPSDGATPSRALPIALMAGGAIAVLGGVGAWAHARDLHHNADETCPVDACTATDAMIANQLEGSARGWGTAGDVALIAGSAAIVGGAAFFFFDRPRHADATALRIAPQIGGATGVVISKGF